MEDQPEHARPTPLVAGSAGLRRFRRPLALLALFLVTSAVLRNALGIDWSTEGVREIVAQAGFWAPTTFILLFVVRLLLVIPSMILLAAGGLLFGAFEGSIYGAIGLTLSGLVNYGIINWAGTRSLQARFSPRLQRLLDLARSPAGVGMLVVMSAYPIGPITFVQLAAAMAGMGIVTYLLAVASGSILRSATFSIFGASIAESDGLVLAALAMAFAFGLPLLVPRSRAWIIQIFGVDSTDRQTHDP